MFNKIKEIVKNYAENYNVLKTAYVERNKELKANFIGKAFDENYQANFNQYNDSVRQLQEVSKINLKEVINQLTESVNKSITADLGMEIIAELNLIKDFDLSEFEIKGYAKKYSGNVKALRMLKGIADIKKIPFSYTSYDDVLMTISDLKSVVISFINGYKGDYRTFGFYNASYDHAVLITGNPVNLAEGVYNDFLNPFIDALS